MWCLLKEWCSQNYVSRSNTIGLEWILDSILNFLNVWTVWKRLFHASVIKINKGVKIIRGIYFNYIFCLIKFLALVLVEV